MPTTWTVTKSGGGGDYNTLASALSNGSTIDGDTIEIQGTWAARDTAVCTVSDAVTIQCDADSKQVGRPWRTGDTHYQHRSTSGHSFTVTDTGTVTFIDLDIQNAATGVSDEIFRNNVSNTFVAERCVLGFDSRTDQQDIYYNDAILDVTFTNCVGYNAYRAWVDSNGGDTGSVVNINSCTAYDIGFNATTNSRSGLIGFNSSNTMTANVANTLAHTNASSKTCTFVSANTTYNFHTLITNVDNLAAGSGTAGASNTANVINATINATDTLGNYIVTDIVSPYNLLLQDSATNNAALTNHSITSFTGTGLTLPTLDILGQTRVTTTSNIDIGAHAIVAAGVGATPKGVFNKPFFGPFGGPL